MAVQAPSGRRRMGGRPPSAARHHADWLNLVEQWFKELTERRLRRGAFSSVQDLVEAIRAWSTHWNQDPRPFVWHARAEEILAKVQRGRTVFNQLNSQTDH